MGHLCIKGEADEAIQLKVRPGQPIIVALVFLMLNGESSLLLVVNAAEFMLVHSFTIIFEVELRRLSSQSFDL